VPGPDRLPYFFFFAAFFFVPFFFPPFFLAMEQSPPRFARHAVADHSDSTWTITPTAIHALGIAPSRSSRVLDDALQPGRSSMRAKL
jgi:hypothetical protein